MSMSQSWMAPKCSVASTASPWCIKVFALLHLKQHETYVVEGSWKSDIEENLVRKLPAHTCKVDQIGGTLGSHPSGFANASFWLGKPSALGPINAGSQRDQEIELSLNLNSSMYFPMAMAAWWWESLHEPGYAWLNMVWFLFLMVFWGKLFAKINKGSVSHANGVPFARCQCAAGLRNANFAWAQNFGHKSVGAPQDRWEAQTQMISAQMVIIVRNLILLEGMNFMTTVAFDMFVNACDLSGSFCCWDRLESPDWLSSAEPWNRNETL